MVRAAEFDVVEANADEAILIFENRFDVTVVFTDPNAGFHGRSETSRRH